MSKIKPNRPSEVIYQIYPSTFKDSNGDGIGDLQGIIDKLDYIEELGVDGIWISPFFKSPDDPKKSDGGYAVSDYQMVDPKFGTNDDLARLIYEAHKRGIRVYSDFVMCHTSDEHDWFEKSRRREDGYEDLYVWADKIPNNWKSVFPGPDGKRNQPAWQFDEVRGQYYLHHFATSQPALNGNSTNARKLILAEMKKLLDTGIDGLRLDALPYANYDPELKDDPGGDAWNQMRHENSICQPATVDYVAEIRALADSYLPKRKITLLGEAIAGRGPGGTGSMEIAKDYVSPESGVDTCYTEMKFWKYPSAQEMKEYLATMLNYFPDGSVCNVFSNHDFSRAASRMFPPGCPEDLRSTVLAQLIAISLSMPGYACIYNGEELGLQDAVIPQDAVKDVDGRDAVRTPIPWDSTQANAGFSSSGKPYLPVPEAHYAMAVDKQAGVHNSVLSTTQRLIADRKHSKALQYGATRIIDTPEPIFAFIRETAKEAVLFVANMSSRDVSLKPADFVDAATLKKLKLTEKSEVILGGYGFTSSGLRQHYIEDESPAPKPSSEPQHIFALDLLLPNIMHNSAYAQKIASDAGLENPKRQNIDTELSRTLLETATQQGELPSIGGATFTVLDALRRLQRDIGTQIDFIGMAAHDFCGEIVRDYIEKADGLNWLTPDWPGGVGELTAVTHAIPNKTGEIVATCSGNEAEAMQQILLSERGLLEKSIAGADKVYMNGTLIEKFGTPIVDEILRLRWKHGKDLILSLPTHANFGAGDAEKFQKLIKSANIVVGSDEEFCRTYGMSDASRPIAERMVMQVAKQVQEAFNEEILRNSGRLTDYDPTPVAFITRGDKPGLLITKDGITKIPVAKVQGGKGGHFGAGDIATAAFIDAEIRGSDHEFAARYAMAMAAEKMKQNHHSRTLDDIEPAARRARESAGLSTFTEERSKVSAPQAKQGQR